MSKLQRIISESIAHVITEDKIDEFADTVRSKAGSGYNMRDLQKDLVANQIKGRMHMIVGQGSRMVFGDEGHKYSAIMDNKWNVVGVQREGRKGSAVIKEANDRGELEVVMLKGSDLSEVMETLRYGEKFDLDTLLPAIIDDSKSVIVNGQKIIQNTERIYYQKTLRPFGVVALRLFSNGGIGITFDGSKRYKQKGIFDTIKGWGKKAIDALGIYGDFPNTPY